MTHLAPFLYVSLGMGMPVVTSQHATRQPVLREPHTDDMRAMVDDLRRRCPAARVPTAFVCAGTIYAHPDLVDRLGETAP